MRNIYLANIHVGDTVTVRCYGACGAMKLGIYRGEVVEEDENSIAVRADGSSWWFYRTGKAYAGNAEIISPE